MAKLFSNSGDSDQMHNAASDQSPFYMSINLFGVSRLKWIKKKTVQFSNKFRLILFSLLKMSFP